MLLSRRLVQRGRLLPVLAVLTVVCFVAFLRYDHSQRGPARLAGLAGQNGPPGHTLPGLKLQALPQKTKTAAGKAEKTENQHCAPELAHLHDGGALNLPETFRYSRRCVRPVFGQRRSSSHAAVHRPATQMPGALIPPRAAATTINRTTICGGGESIPQLPPCEPLALDVTRPYPQQNPANYSHLLFGVSSSHARMLKALDGFAHWLGGTDAQLIAIIHEDDDRDNTRKTSGDGGDDGDDDDKADQEKLLALEMAYRARAVRLRALAPQNRTRTVVHNHFTVLASLLDAAFSSSSSQSVTKPTTTWLGIIDDDTFFPSLFKLDQTLGAYNHSRPTWLGALSEDFDSVALWGYMAYGGAGVFLSVPLAQQLAPHLDECIAAAEDKGHSKLATATIAQKQAMSATLGATALRDSAAPGGDGILRDCIYSHTATKLTVVPGLYQHDLYGDIAGFYESGVLPVSVHHWRTWYKAPLPQMAAVNRLCGDCFLARWQFAADDNNNMTLLANGYSITQYTGNATSLAAIDLAQMEATWSHTGREFDFSLGPLRRALDEDEKKSYRLRDAIVDKAGTGGGGGRGTGAVLRQVYVYEGDFLIDEMDEVFELIWEMPEGEGE